MDGPPGNRILIGARAMKPAGLGSTHRERIVLFLAFLTSRECLDLCKRAANSEEVAATLSGIWFDDLYVPGESYLNAVKGDRRDDEVLRFQASFTEGELLALERFHGFFELRASFLSNSRHGRAHFPENDSWRGLLRHAEHLLSELAPDPDYLRSVLAALARRAEAGAAELEQAFRSRRRLADEPG